MQFQTVAGPFCRALEGIVCVGSVIDEIIAEFASDDSFFDVGGGAVGVFFEGANVECEALEGYVSVVDPGGEVGAYGLIIWIVAIGVKVFPLDIIIIYHVCRIICGIQRTKGMRIQ